MCMYKKVLFYTCTCNIFTTRAELVAKPRVGLPLLLRVENICYDYNDYTFSSAFVIKMCCNWKSVYKTCFEKRKEENILGKLFVEQSLCNRFKHSLKSEMFNGELNFQG